MILAPLLSEKDLRDSSEGSIDPLGTYTIAEALATRLVPGVRERQRHPRFLTAMAVSLAVCSHCDDDIVASDGISPPWQVFEWYLVEGLVRTLDKSRRTGLPGSAKVEAAIVDGVPLSANRYLKTPAVFGFHGVYRVLARQLGIELAGRLGEAGYELLTIWAREQGLDGFSLSNESGAGGLSGAAWRRELTRAVDDGLKISAVARPLRWSGWAFMGDHLGLLDMGRQEARYIWDLLRRSDSGFRNQVLEFLVSPTGQAAVGRDEPWTHREHRFHQELAHAVLPECRRLIQAIQAYEAFARLIQNAFDSCLALMSRAAAKLRAEALAASPHVERAAREIPSHYEPLVDQLLEYHQAVPFQGRFARLSERLAPALWVSALFEHHEEVQRQKPPDGKDPWVVRLETGDYLLKTAYSRTEEPDDASADAYVHGYRTATLQEFAHDLGRVR